MNVGLGLALGSWASAILPGRVIASTAIASPWRNGLAQLPSARPTRRSSEFQRYRTDDGPRRMRQS